MDDTLLTKTGKGMELICNHFDHCSFSMKYGLSLVSLHYLTIRRIKTILKEVYSFKRILQLMH
ncbi:MAG: hypothetical protein ACTSVV_10640 [Promethearchaeota archaeon]